MISRRSFVAGLFASVALPPLMPKSDERMVIYAGCIKPGTIITLPRRAGHYWISNQAFEPLTIRWCDRDDVMVWGGKSVEIAA